MFTGININEVKKYISPNDPDKENPTIFYLNSLDQIIKNHIEDNSTEYEFSSSGPEAESTVKILYAKRTLLIVKFGVRKIENFRDPETKQPVIFEAEKININGNKVMALPDKVVAILPGTMLITELANEILKINSLGPEERKN